MEATQIRSIVLSSYIRLLLDLFISWNGHFGRQSKDRTIVTTPIIFSTLPRCTADARSICIIEYGYRNKIDSQFFRFDFIKSDLWNRVDRRTDEQTDMRHIAEIDWMTAWLLHLKPYNYL